MPAPKGHWLVKSEPDTYSFDALTRDRRTVWDGIRNYQARNHLRGMKKGDPVLYYHTGEEKAVVGVAEVAREAFPDPSAKEGDWSAVELAPGKKLARPVTLAEIKADKAFASMPLITHARLSVMEISKAHFDAILKRGAK